MNNYLRIFAALFACMLVCLIGYDGYVLGQKSVQAKWDVQRAIDLQDAITSEKTYRAKERQLQAAADKARQDKTHETYRLDLIRGRMLDGLHNRAERPDSPDMPALSSDGQTTLGCGGAQLYRADATFLVGEAARADTVRLQLLQCQAVSELGRAE